MKNEMNAQTLEDLALDLPGTQRAALAQKLLVSLEVQSDD